MARTDTKTTILDAAEALFAEVGFAAASLRQLTARAGVNLAAVHYHFGSKDELAIAVLERRLGPVNAERARRLELLPEHPPVAAILRAFVAPVLAGVAGAPPARPTTNGAQRTAATPAFCRLFGRIMVEQPPFLRGFLARQFRGLGSRFAAVLGKALPDLRPATLWWRLHFLVGAMAHTLQNGEALAHVSGGACAVDDAAALGEELVAFAAAGMQAPDLPRGAAAHEGARGGTRAKGAAGRGRRAARSGADERARRGAGPGSRR